MDLVYCVVSYKRPEICFQKTVSFLEEQKVDKSKIHIFVGGTQEDFEAYRLLCPPQINLHSAPVGLPNARNSVYDFFPPLTPIIMLDDDVRGFLHKSNPSFSFEDECKKGFQRCNELNCNLFGFYPVANKLFMKDRIKNGCLFIYGCCFGIINPHSSYRDFLSFKEDWYRSCAFYKLDKNTVRIEYLSPLQSYRKQKGGLSLTRSIELEENEVQQILQLFPDLVTRKKVKTEWPELRMKKINTPIHSVEGLAQKSSHSV